MMGKLSNFKSTDEGFTLIEVLLALVIFTVAGIVFVIGVGTAVQASDRHRKEATVQTILRDQAEALYAVAAKCTASGSISYAPTVPSGYTISVAYSDASGTAIPGTPACPAVSSWVNATISAQSTDQRSANSTVTIAVRTP